MNSLVQVADGQIVVSSRNIAEHFEKRHADVLAGIENIKTENSAVTPMVGQKFFKNLLTFVDKINNIIMSTKQRRVRLCQTRKKSVDPLRVHQRR